MVVVSSGNTFCRVADFGRNYYRQKINAVDKYILGVRWYRLTISTNYRLTKSIFQPPEEIKM